MTIPRFQRPWETGGTRMLPRRRTQDQQSLYQVKAPGSFVTPPSLTAELPVLPSHPSLDSPSRLHSFQNLLLDLLLLRTSLADHGDENRRTVEFLGQLVSAPCHRIVQTKATNFFDVRRGQVIFELWVMFGDTGKIMDIDSRSRFGAYQSARIVGRKEFVWSVVDRWSARGRVVNNLVTALMRRTKRGVRFDA